MRVYGLNIQLHIDELEIVEHKWFSLKEALTLPIYNALRTFLGEIT